MQIPDFLFNSITIFGASALLLLCKTLRIEFKDRLFKHGLMKSGKGIIFCLWHDRLLYSSYLYRGIKVHILVSQSRDGELIARLLERFGYETIRGSSSKGGTQAMHQLVKTARSGKHTAVTTDGPRGPRHVVQPGVIQLARLSGNPILPLSFSAERRKNFKSWDKFLLPLPFSRGVVVYGQPLSVPGKAAREEMELCRLNLERELKRITAVADDYFVK